MLAFPLFFSVLYQCLLSNKTSTRRASTTALAAGYLYLVLSTALQARWRAFSCRDVSCGLPDTYANLYNVILCKVFEIFKVRNY